MYKSIIGYITAINKDHGIFCTRTQIGNYFTVLVKRRLKRNVKRLLNVSNYVRIAGKIVTSEKGIHLRAGSIHLFKSEV